MHVCKIQDNNVSIRFDVSFMKNFKKLLKEKGKGEEYLVHVGFKKKALSDYLATSISCKTKKKANIGKPAVNINLTS